ncbi:MAG TPA: alginate lyase family protein [Pedobacter sp.]|nr:alginate lyase family protein [Pedobacter sp.]
MLQKLKLLFNTIKYLKFIQLFYQIYFRINPAKPLSYYRPKDKNFSFYRLSFTVNVLSSDIVSPTKTFTFLNLAKKFPDQIDWNFQEYGKLWNYNLQYFNYLHQNDLTEKSKESWLMDIGKWLKEDKLKLEPYPVSLRVMNTIRYYSSKRIPHIEVVKDMYGQLKYLSKYCEFHLLGNHLLENAFALMMGGHVFKNENWINKSKKILCRELNEQILADGAHFELSPMYHQIILFRVLELIDWYKEQEIIDDEFLLFITMKASKMLQWLNAMTFKNGDIPHFNDSSFEISLTSFELFRIAKSLDINYSLDINLKECGYRKFSGDDYECVIDIAKIGPSYQPGHGHADALSFILYKSNQPFLVEAGTSTYEIGEKRDFERSTAAHNSVVIGSKNQSEVWGAFRVGKRASTEIFTENKLGLEAGHNGYLKNFKAYHKRLFSFGINSVEILDLIDNAEGQLFLHFHPNCNITKENENLIRIEGVGSLELENNNTLCLQEYEFSNGFNKYMKAQKLVADFKGTIKTSIHFN